MNKQRHVFLYIFLVYFTVVLVRLLLAWQTYDSPLHILNGEFLSILTYDAALYGHYAKLLLNGVPHINDVYMIEYIIYYLVKYTPFTLEQIMYYTPAFLSTLIVIPTMLISLLYIHSKTIIIIIGLLSGIGYGYYSRTYLGYFDTDVLNVFFPMFMLYGMVSTIKKENYYYFIIVIVSIVLYLFWYRSAVPLIYSMIGIFIFYYLIVILKKHHFSLQKYKYPLTFIFIVSVLLLYNIDLNTFTFHIKRYLFKDNLLQINQFNFIAPMQHLSEAKSTTISFIAHHISGNIYLLIMALLGYFVLVFKHREMILALPIILLGLLSLYLGVRFHIYATAVFIISYFFLLYTIIIYFAPKKIVLIAIIILFTIPTIYENYKHIQYWNNEGAKPVFYPEQVLALKKLKKIKQQNDYAITWWDYGWPILYYTGLKTMIDNGIHHSDNYTVANILLSKSQKFTHHAGHYFYNLFNEYPNNTIVQALKKYKNTKDLFQAINNNSISNKNNIDKYIILPEQIASLIYTIYTFANINPVTGLRNSNHKFKMFTRINEDKKYIYLNSNSKIDKTNSTLITEGTKVFIKKVSLIRYGNKKKNIIHKTILNTGLNLIVSEGKYYIMDDYFYQSTLVQMLFFDHYDKKYFTPIYVGKTISIYKLKN